MEGGTNWQGVLGFISRFQVSLVLRSNIIWISFIRDGRQKVVQYPFMQLKSKKNTSSFSPFPSRSAHSFVFFFSFSHQYYQFKTCLQETHDHHRHGKNLLKLYIVDWHVESTIFHRWPHGTIWAKELVENVDPMKIHFSFVQYPRQTSPSIPDSWLKILLRDTPKNRRPRSHI